MPETSLLTVCATALVAVFTLLSLLAIVIWLTTAAFPAREQADDTAVFAAVSAAAAVSFPGARVTRIEEEK